MSEKVKQSGRISLKVLKTFFLGYGGCLGIVPCFILLIIGHSLAMYGIVLVNSFLVNLDKMDFSEKMEGLKFIASVAIVTFVLIQGTELCFKLLGNSFSESLHSKMVMSILHAKTAEFHDSTPLGVIINRFTNDIDFIDRNLAELSYLIFLPGAELLLATYTYFAVVTGMVFKIGFFFYLLMIIATQNIYLKASNNLTRHATATKSPIVHLSLGIGTGIAHIRALGIEKFFSKKCQTAVDNSVKYYPLIFGLEAGYNYWVALCNFMCVYIPGTAFVSYSIILTGGSTKTLNVTLLKLFMSNAKKIGSNIIQVIKALNKLESKLVYVERCKLYTDLEPEENYFNYIKQIGKRKLYFPKKKILQKLLPKENQEAKLIRWGEVKFEMVCARYPNTENMVLRNVCLSVRPGEKVGIVGRSGAGKSSFIKLLWNYLGPTSGRILIDGVDIASIDLEILRREISIISQDSAIFSGTLRENLSPSIQGLKDQKKDTLDVSTKEQEMLSILESLNFQNRNFQKSGLDMMIDIEGTALSEGEKQIICFVREILDPKRVAILDEATSNLDCMVEKEMKKLTTETFMNSTVFIIAHKLESIFGCDTIIVMEEGVIVEVGNPGVLE